MPINAPSLSFSFIVEGSSSEPQPEPSQVLAEIQVRVNVHTDFYVVAFGDSNVISGVEFALGGAAGGVQLGGWFELQQGVHSISLIATASVDAVVQGTWGARAHVTALPRAV